MVGTSLRKPANILKAYLQSLAWQVVPPNVDLRFIFVDDGLDDEAGRVLQEFFKDHEGGVLTDNSRGPTHDFSDTHPVTHQWSESAMRRVGQHKDQILAYAREHRAEAVWLADADLIMDPMTLTSLWSVPEQIVCGVYWTRWSKNPPEMQPVHAGPQVWQTHPYGLGGNGMEEWELRRELINRQLVQVYGQGACTLIRRGALQKGVSFAPWPSNTAPGLMQGEDRHFCIRAEALHIKMVADGWPDIFHIYHRPEDEALIPEMLKKLGDHPAHPLERPLQFGDLVSLELTPLEPILGAGYFPPQLVRGRLGKLGLHPELEQAVSEMESGTERIVPTHFGLDYPFPPYRGKRRLIRVRLIDHKPFGFPPVVDQEVFVNNLGGWLDTTTITPELDEQVREVHAG